MLVFFLFETINFDILQLDKISESLSRLEDKPLAIEISSIELANGPNPYKTGVHLRAGYPGQEKLFNLFFWNDSNVLLIDSKSNLDTAHSILDVLGDLIGLKVKSLQPTSEHWVNFIREGDKLLRAYVATRWGLQEISQDEDFSWEKLISLPLVSATISFRHPKSFYVIVSSGTLTIQEPLKVEIIGYLSYLVTKHIVNGEKWVESNHKN